MPSQPCLTCFEDTEFCQQGGYALRTHDVGLTFKSNVLDWDKLVCLVVTDASHANES